MNSFFVLTQNDEYNTYLTEYFKTRENAENRKNELTQNEDYELYYEFEIKEVNFND